MTLFFEIASDIYDFIKKFDAFVKQATNPTAATYEAHFFIEIPENPKDQITMQIAINPSTLSAYEQMNLEQISRYGEKLSEIIISRDKLEKLSVTDTTVDEIEKWLSRCFAQFEQWRKSNEGKPIVALYFEGKYLGTYLKSNEPTYHDYTQPPNAYIKLPHMTLSLEALDTPSELHNYARELLIYIKKLQMGMYSGPSPFGKEPEKPSLSFNQLTEALTDLQSLLQTLAQKLAA